MPLHTIHFPLVPSPSGRQSASEDLPSDGSSSPPASVQEESFEHLLNADADADGWMSSFVGGFTP